MKCELVPSEVSEKVPFVLPSYNSSKDESNLCGRISKSGSFMWLVNNASIDFCNTRGEWCGGHNFEQALKNPYAKILDGVEFTSAHLPFPVLAVVVNQDHDSLICVMNANSKTVERVILIPENVTSIDVLSGSGGACRDTHYLNPRLRYMFGIVAVGTVNGHIYLLDLCLDEDFSCNEDLPNITAVVSKKDFTAQRREIAISKKQHVFMRLNDKSIQDGCFQLQSRSNTLGRFPCDDVFVTALQYIHSLATLAVGFSFGGIQLWNLQDLSLQFTISTSPHEQPVISFAFQEPENDPRNFCYLWVISGPLPEETKPKEVTVASLYSFTYNKRKYDDEFGMFYTDLQSCNKRFEYPLTNDPFKPLHSNSSIGTRLISCQAVHLTDSSQATDMKSGNASESLSEETSLCFFSWEVWFDGETSPSSYHLVVFDLNQWYQAQMPFHFRCDYGELSPFMAIYSLETVAQNLHREPVLGIYAVPQNIKKFKSLAASEEFFYPSALSFYILCYSSSGLVKATYRGIQRYLLSEMAKLGPQVLINPKDMYSSLMVTGLVDACSDADAVPLLTQRETLLQLALEYHYPYFFVKCLKEWRYSDSVHECCTSRALLNWVWKSVKNIKSSIDKLSLPLFNCCGFDIDGSSLKHLYCYKRQLNFIDSVISAYQEYVTPRTEQGIQDLQCRKDVVNSINLYLQVLLWLRSVHILPEVCEGEEVEGASILYPVNSLVEAYALRRRQLQSIHSSIGSTDILLIDGLIEEADVSNTWQEKGGTYTYPPPSIYAAVSCYLVESVSTELIHAILYYLLLDIYNFSSSNGNDLSDSGLKKFPIIFGMSQSMEKLIEAFWFLDRQDFEEAINRFLNPAIRTSDILPWQHQRIIKSFLYLREPQKALKFIDYMDPPQNSVEEMKLYLSVLLSHGAITRAFYYQRKKQNGPQAEELLIHLFRGCQEMHKMKELLYMPMNTFESSLFVKYLSENEDFRAQEVLVIYHLRHCNYSEASRVNERLSHCQLSGKPFASDRAVDRDALVETYLAAVPRAEKRLVEEIKRLPSRTFEKAGKSNYVLQPLSLPIRQSSTQGETYSDFLNALMCSASAMFAPSPCNAADSHFALPHENKTPLKARSGTSFEDFPFLRPPVTPECARPSVEPMRATPILKRNLSSTNCNEESSPTKKSRLLDNATFKVGLSSKRSIPKNLAGDVASLLQTPPIHRKSSKLDKTSIFRQSTPVPQSILKKPTQTPKCKEIDSPVLSSISGWSEKDKESDDELLLDTLTENPLIADSENLSRQIRFNVTVKDQSSVKESTIPPEIVSGTSSEQGEPLMESSISQVEKSKNLRSKLNVHISEVNEGIMQRKALTDLKRRHLKLASENITPVPPSESVLSEKSINSIEFVGRSIEVASSASDSLSNLPECFHEEPVSEEKIAKVTVTDEKMESKLPVSCDIEMSSSIMGQEDSVFTAPPRRSFVISPRRPLRQSNSISPQCEQDTEEKTKTDSSLKERAADPIKLVFNPDEECMQMDSPESDTFFSPSSDFDFDTPSSSKKPQPRTHCSSVAKSIAVFERNEIRQEILHFLKEEESVLPKGEFIPFEKKTVTSQPKKFVFRKSVFPQSIETELQEEPQERKKVSSTKESDKDVSESRTSFWLTSATSQTYEEFSSTLRNRIPDSGKDGEQAFVSSPTDNESKEKSKEISKGTTKGTEESGSDKTCTDVKKNVKEPSSVSTPRLPKKKGKAKDKISKKTEFSFAEPHSPAGPEILEALSSPPDHPVPTFMFSPPLTRGRLRQKRLSESMESSFSSTASNVSFQEKKPPVDAILEKIMQEKAPESKALTATKLAKSIKKKAIAKKTKLHPILESSDGSSILDKSSMNQSKNLSQSPSMHSMVLRQGKVKKKAGNVSFSSMQ
ncbi:protein ELYS-like isoform X2 [Stegodyphus dumicola]|uniref:protein ELYS-like isoform X2 n=1 Tax=Stegodyphus dumicola TaxID=202533 RepID=UPI0015AF6212|nr:protein ELYS-like isoform X2 [Stegodyphus dumicola]